MKLSYEMNKKSWQIQILVHRISSRLVSHACYSSQFCQSGNSGHSTPLNISLSFSQAGAMQSSGIVLGILENFAKVENHPRLEENTFEKL